MHANLLSVLVYIAMHVGLHWDRTTQRLSYLLKVLSTNCDPFHINSYHARMEREAIKPDQSILSFLQLVPADTVLLHPGIWPLCIWSLGGQISTTGICNSITTVYCRYGTKHATATTYIVLLKGYWYISYYIICVQFKQLTIILWRSSSMRACN